MPDKPKPGVCVCCGDSNASYHPHSIVTAFSNPWHQVESATAELTVCSSCVTGESDDAICILCRHPFTISEHYDGELILQDGSLVTFDDNTTTRNHYLKPWICRDCNPGVPTDVSDDGVVEITKSFGDFTLPCSTCGAEHPPHNRVRAGYVAINTATFTVNCRSCYNNSHKCICGALVPPSEVHLAHSYSPRGPVVLEGGIVDPAQLVLCHACRLSSRIPDVIFNRDRPWDYHPSCKCDHCRWVRAVKDVRTDDEFLDIINYTIHEWDDNPRMGMCCYCGERRPSSVLTPAALRSEDSGIYTDSICHACVANEEDFRGDVFCGCGVFISSSVYETLNYTLACEDCIEDLGGSWCPNCHVYLEDGEECERCDSVMPWNYRPAQFTYLSRPTDSPTHEPYLGFELEIEQYSGISSRAIGSRYIESNCSTWAYTVHDGTLLNRGQGGFELVSQPMTYGWFQDNFSTRIAPLLEWLSTKGFRSWETKRCGMHVHVDRRHMTKAHQMKFINFIYNNPSLCICIGQRSHRDPYLQRYAPFDREARAQFMQKITHFINPGVDGHYAALNADHRDTLEARWFRGTLNPESFRKNIEFIRAAYEFTRIYGHTSANEINFIGWLSESLQRGRFATLLAYINMNYITRR